MTTLVALHLTQIIGTVSLFVPRSPNLDIVLQMWSQKCHQRRYCLVLHSCAAQDVIGHLCCKDTLMNHIQLLSTKTPLSLQSCCHLTTACTGEQGYSFQGAGLCILPCWTSWFSHQLTSPNFWWGFSNSSPALWFMNHSLSLMSSVKLLKVHNC